MEGADPSPPLNACGKVLNACDECRFRKMRCSGESTGCTRCLKFNISCHYSARKQMGRPRKRRREDGELNQDQDPALQFYWEGETGSLQDPVPMGPLGLYDANDTPDMLPNGSSLLPTFDVAPEFYDSLPVETNPAMGSSIHDHLDDLQDFTHIGSATDPQACAAISSGSISLQDSDTLSNRCMCLPLLYRFLGSFRSTPDPSFPYSMMLLKKAARLSTDVVRCQECSKEYASALQNSMLLGTLVDLVINNYEKLLRHIDERSMGSEKMTFRMGERSPATDHLHTGTLDCPMGFDIDLTGDEWRTFARKTVRKELLGPGDYNLKQILQEMQDRQQRWHSQHDDKHIALKENAANDDNANLSEKNDCICTHLLYINRLGQKLDALDIR